MPHTSLISDCEASPSAKPGYLCWYICVGSFGTFGTCVGTFVLVHLCWYICVGTFGRVGVVEEGSGGGGVMLVLLVEHHLNAWKSDEECTKQRDVG